MCVALALALQLAPALPSDVAVFDDPLVQTEILERCSKANGPDTCASTNRAAVARFKAAYGSDATTLGQRLMALQFIDAERARGDVDWLGLTQRYFAWRANATGETARALEKALRDRPPPTTSETRCVSFYYSSRCVTTTR